MAEQKDIKADQVHGKVDPKTHREETPDVCEQCKVDNTMLPAVGWCETCGEMLCNGCYTYHCKPKSMKDHQLMSIADMKNMKQKKRMSVKCDKHEGEPLKYFCMDHSELGCSQCFVTRHRPCGQVVCIADVKTNDLNEFKTLESLLSQFETRLKTNEETVERNLSLTARQHDKAIADIKEAGDKLKAHIDDLVKQQILKAQKRNEDNKSKMSCVEETNKDIAKTVMNGKEMLAAVKNDNTRLFVTMKHVQHEVEKITTKFDEDKNKKTVNKYEFELSSELADVLEKVKQLGTLKDTKLLNLEKTTDEVVEVVEVRRSKRLGQFKSYEGEIRDMIQVSTDHDIRLQHVLVHAYTKGDTEVSLTISEGGNCLTRCNSTYKKEADQSVVAVNVVNEGGADGITLQASHQYVINVTCGVEPRGSFYYGAGEFYKVTEKGVTVTFSNTNGTRPGPGIIAGLRFIIV